MKKYRNRKEYVKRYRRTHYGLVSRLVDTQKQSSDRRGHPRPLWSYQEMYVYCMNSPLFLKLFNEWQESDYDESLKPSIDRIDCTLPYTWDNIQFMTSDQNRYVKRAIEMGRPVFQIKNGEIIKKFNSIIEAEREFGKEGSGLISKCVRLVNERGYGYEWRYCEL